MMKWKRQYGIVIVALVEHEVFACLEITKTSFHVGQTREILMSSTMRKCQF